MGKIFLKLVIMLGILMSGLLIYLNYFFDLNQYKPVIEDYVEERFGSQLDLKGEFKFSFYPQLGFQIADVTLSQTQGLTRAGYQQPFLEIGSLITDIELLGLFERKLNIRQVYLDQVEINYIEDSSQLNSLTEFVSKDTAQTKQDVKPDATTEQLNISLDGLSFSHVYFNYLPQEIELQKKVHIEKFVIEDLSEEQLARISGRFSYQQADLSVLFALDAELAGTNQWQQLQFPSLTVSIDVDMKDPQAKDIRSQIDTQLLLDTQKQQLEINDFAININEIKAQGKFDVNYGAAPLNLEGRLAFEDMDLTALTQASTEESKPQPSETIAQEPDLSALKQIDLDLALQTGVIQWQQLKLDSAAVTIQVKQGVLSAEQLFIELYQGQLMGDFSLQSIENIAHYQINQKLQGLQLQPLLQAVGDTEILTGVLNMDLQGQGESLHPEKLLAHLKMQGDVALTDGALYGINIPMMVRNIKDFSLGKNTGQGQEQKTDFSSITASFDLSSGVIENQDLELLSPLLTLRGAGEVDLIKQQIDYSLQPSLTASLSGQGRAESAKQVTIPLTVSGALTEPKFGLDTENMAKQELEKQKQKLEEKVKEKLLDKLGGFL